MRRVAFPCPAHCCIAQNLPRIQLPGGGVWSSWSRAGRLGELTSPGAALPLPWKLWMPKAGSPTAMHIPWLGLMAKGMELSRSFPTPWLLLASLPGKMLQPRARAVSPLPLSWLVLAALAGASWAVTHSSAWCRGI